MSDAKRGLWLLGGLATGAVAVVVGVVVYTIHQRQPSPPTVGRVLPENPATAPADVVSAHATTQHADAAAGHSTYMDVVRADYPAMPTTQPLAVPIELNQAARLIFKEPIYLSPAAGDLWLTREDAPPTPQVLKQAADPEADVQVHILREQVVFVHWIATDFGRSLPYLICRNGSAGFDVVSADHRQKIPVQRQYQWEHAFSWGDRIVVPSERGISVLEIRPELKESYRQLIGDDGPPGQPQVLPDGEGLLAWAPWASGARGSNGAVRYLDGKWIELGPEQGWPAKLAYLVPLRDGTVFQFVMQDNGTIALQTASLGSGSVDEAAIAKLVGQLSDADPQVRRNAVTELANFGPGAWPALTRLSADQPPQARLLLKQLLKDKNRPTLSGMALLGDRALQLAARLSDGGAVFYAPQGVSIPNPDGDDPDVNAPAWLSARPGHYVELLPPLLMADVKPDACNLDVVADQWVLNNDVRGPRLFFGNGLATLLRKDERPFSRVVGMDQRGRWLFRHPTGDSPTLVIDPHLPDPTPRLPAWNLNIAQVVGWDKDNWPVVQNGAAYALNETDWRAIGPDEKIYIHPGELPPSTMPATVPSTLPTTDASDDVPLLITNKGDRYFGGLSDLTLVQADGKRLHWTLPDIANGAGPATLILANSGKLFLFNQPGRVLRIARVADGSEPFVVDATFTRNIPSAIHPTRIWLDPAGRIDIAWGNHLTLLFPDGYIPKAISEKIVDQGGLDAEFQ